MDCTPILVKYCGVCGDKASGFNYKGLCCASCKVFFLRNSTDNELLICSKNGNCQINKLTRKDCAKCRLAKCFANGMMMKTSKNADNNGDFVHQTASLDACMRSVLQNINYFTCLEPAPFDQPNAQYLNLPQFPYISTRKRKHASELIASERQVIANVQNVLSEAFVDESRLTIVGQVSRLADTFHHFALYTRKIVQFCKSIPAFAQLATNDQLILLKSSFYEILITRLVYVQDRVNAGYPIIENERSTQAMFMKLDLLLEFKNQELTQQEIKFQNALYDELESDFTIRDLLITILLFTPRPNLSNAEFVHYQYALYCRLLRRYLEHKYKNVTKAERKFQTLARMAATFGHQKDMSRFLVQSELDIQQIPPIIVEIMDF